MQTEIEEVIYDNRIIKKEVWEDTMDFGFGSIQKIDKLLIQERRLANLKSLIGDLPQKGEFYFVEHTNFFNGLSFIRLLIECFGRIDELYACTYNISQDGIEYFVQNIGTRIKHTALVVNERFKCEDTKFMPMVVKRGVELDFVFSPTHKKVILARIGDEMLGMEGSANITGVSKNEQSIIYNHNIIYEFRRIEIVNEIEKRKKYDRFK